jgi:hypothetical protein
MRRSVSIFSASFVLSLMLVISRPSAAQVLYGSIVGAVTDPSGAVVPGAHVTVLDSATGEIR